jgi:hypothetical protein
MGDAGRARFEREFTFDLHARRMRHMLLETAGPECVTKPSTIPRTTAVSPVG